MKKIELPPQRLAHMKARFFKVRKEIFKQEIKPEQKSYTQQKVGIEPR